MSSTVVGRKESVMLYQEMRRQYKVFYYPISVSRSDLTCLLLARPRLTAKVNKTTGGPADYFILKYVLYSLLYVNLIQHRLHPQSFVENYDSYINNEPINDI